MKFKGLDGKEYSPALYGREVDLTIEKSSLHLLARKIIFEIFKPAIIIEEFNLPGSGGLFADFFIPFYKIIIEVHGIQHYKYSHFFHGDLRGFRESQKRDKRKIEWCELNNIKLIELPYNEDEDGWRERINDR